MEVQELNLIKEKIDRIHQFIIGQQAAIHQANENIKAARIESAAYNVILKELINLQQEEMSNE